MPNARPRAKTLNRRAFLAGGASLGLAGVSADLKPTLDIHVHLFGIGEAGTGCRMSPKVTAGLQFQFLVHALGLKAKGKPLDEEYERVLAEQVAGCGLTKAAILGQDAVYDRHGKPDWDRTSFFVPNDYVFAVVARHSKTMIPCPSINPDRADAVEEVVRIHEKGAKLFKIHPPTQGVDVADRRHRKFFEKCSVLGLVVLVHTGHEHSAPVIDKDLAAPRQLEFALDLGCTVVACHAGTGWKSDTPDQLPQFLAMLNHYPKLYGDTSVLGTAGRVHDFGRLLDAPGAKERLLHGSDFPFPAVPSAFIGRIDKPTAERLSNEPNWIKRDFALKDALGIGRQSAELAFQLVMKT